MFFVIYTTNKYSLFVYCTTKHKQMKWERKGVEMEVEMEMDMEMEMMMMTMTTTATITAAMVLKKQKFLLPVTYLFIV